MIITPEVTHGIISRRVNTSFPYHGWPTVARDENGVLYAVASAFRAGHVCPFGKTAMFISRNNGKTWTPPIVINDTYLDDRDAGILYMGNGRMLVTWFTHPADLYQNDYYDEINSWSPWPVKAASMGMLAGYDHLSEEERKGGSYVRVSEDYGVTWSEKIRIPVSAPHGPCLCRDGSLIYLGSEMHSYGELPEKTIAAYKSCDGGYTWQKAGEVVLPEDIPSSCFSEPHVIELPDGRLFGLIRAQGKEVRDGCFECPDGEMRYGYTMLFTVSEDSGKTWSVPEYSSINGAPGHLMLHSSGALILSYSRREKPFSERAAVSYDLGKTWEDDYVIDDRPWDFDMGYPSTVELDDGSLFTIYYQKLDGEAINNVLCTHWNLK